MSNLSQTYVEHITNLGKYFRNCGRIPHGLNEAVKKFIEATTVLEQLRDKDVEKLLAVGNTLRRSVYNGKPFYEVNSFVGTLDGILSKIKAKDKGRLQEETTNLAIATTDTPGPGANLDGGSEEFVCPICLFKARGLREFNDHVQNAHGVSLKYGAFESVSEDEVHPSQVDPDILCSECLLAAGLNRDIVHRLVFQNGEVGLHEDLMLAYSASNLDEAKKDKKKKPGKGGRVKMLRLLFALGVLIKGKNGKVKLDKEAAKSNAGTISHIRDRWSGNAPSKQGATVL